LKAIDAILDFLAGKAMTVILMFVAAAAMAMITLFEALEGSSGVVFRYYYSSWFLALLTLVWLNLFANMTKAKWWRWRRMHLSLTHLGFLLILTGGAMTWAFGLRGDLSLMEGETRDVFRTQDSVLNVTTEDGSAESFVIKDHESLKGGSLLSRINPFAARDRVEVHGGTVSLLEAMESSRMRTEIVEAEEGPCAVVLELEAGGKQRVVLQNGEEVELNHPAVSRIAYRFIPEGEEIPASLFDAFDEWIEVQPPEGDSLKIPVKTPDDVGKTFEEGKYTVKIVEYYPDFKMGQEPDYAAPPRNPAVRLDVKGPDASGLVYSFAMIEFHGNALSDGTQLLYHRPASGKTALLISRSPERLESYESTDEEPRVASQSDPLVFGNAPMQLKIRLDAFWPASTTEQRVTFDRTGRGPAAYKISVGGGEPAWLSNGRGEALSPDGRLRATVDNSYPLGFALTLDDAVAEFWPVSSIPKAYYSLVDVSDTGEARIETNDPLYRNGFRLYQSSMDQEPPYRFSVFAVSRDPGVLPVALGFVMMSFAMLWLYWQRFIMKPIKARRKA
jgi:hypothetical protein